MMYGSSTGNPIVKNVTTVIAGILFSMAWFFVINYGLYASPSNPDTRDLKVTHYLSGIFLSLSILIFNAWKWEDFDGQGFSEFNASRARVFFFIGLTGIISCMIGGIFVAYDNYFKHFDNSHHIGGVAILVNVFLLALSGILLRITDSPIMGTTVSM